jgi:hypothetical protein
MGVVQDFDGVAVEDGDDLTLILWLWRLWFFYLCFQPAFAGGQGRESFSFLRLPLPTQVDEV